MACDIFFSWRMNWRRVRAACSCSRNPKQISHPERQRHLLHGLQDAVHNQFIVTTHSSVLLDEGRAPSVFRVHYDGFKSSCSSVVTSVHLFDVLDDLGLKPSDLLQANVAIWVEGPSDRLFIVRCLELLDQSLTEGIDYQCVPYGGALRKYLSTEAGDGKRVNILRLCRSPAVIADSDRSISGGPIDAEKGRLGSECKEIGGYSWITEGREIENYLSSEGLRRTLIRLCPDLSPIPDLGAFDRLEDVLASIPEQTVPMGMKWIRSYAKHKVRFMAEVMKDMALEDLDVLDLQQRLGELIEFIQAANS